jgi:adenylate kinase
LAEKLKIPHISLGDMLREEVRVGSEIGKRAKDIMEAGRLVPDELTIELTRKRIGEPDCKRGFIIDGFPRSMAQAEGFDRILAEKDLLIDRVFYFRIPEEEAVKRLVLRGRHDDEESVIRARFEVYEKQTRPLIEHYAGLKKLVEIDAAQTIDRVFQQLWEL